MATPQKKVVIIGMGFGGIRAAAALAGQGLDVLVIDRRNFHLFQPLLYQVATAMLDQESVAYSIRALVRKWPGVHFQMSEVLDVDFENKQVVTDDNTVPYDYLVVAAGSVTNFFGNKDVEKYAFDLKKLHDAVNLRNHVLAMFEDAVTITDLKVRDEYMTFVIVGGGPTGVEFAGALSELIRHALSKDFKELPWRRSQIILVESNDRVLKAYPRRLSAYALRRLKRMGVKVLLNTRVVGVDEKSVLLKDGTCIRARTMFWSAGVRAAPLSDALKVPKVQGGRIPVQPNLSIKEQPDVFVIGDMMHLEQNGAPLPGIAPVAMQGGEYVAKVILARKNGQPEPEPFSYFDKGTMAVIGRSSAVASAFGINLTGFVAWIAWLGLHIVYLIGFRNRLMTMISWIYTFLANNAQVRLITREGRERGQ